LQLGRARAVRLEAFPAEDQLEPPAAASEFAVGHGAQPRALLHGDNLAHAFVFHFPEPWMVVRTYVAGGGLWAEECLARLLELFRTQQAPDVVGAKRWLHRPPILSL
jgi:hypothetical protein